MSAPLCTPTAPNSGQEWDLNWADKYSDTTEYRAKMLAESRAFIAAGKEVWKNYSNQKLSDEEYRAEMLAESHVLIAAGKKFGRLIPIRN